LEDVTSNSKKRWPGRSSKYPPEFRKDAVAMVLDEDR
jgi:transposase-like protein